MANNSLDPSLLIQAVAGAVIGAMTEAFNEVCKELRTYAGSDFDKRLDLIEANIVRSIKNAPFDGIAEQDQLALIEQTRSIVVAAFRDARKI